MAIPVTNAIPLTGNPLIDGLTQGSAWTFGGGPHTLTYSLDLNFDGPTTPWTPELTTGVADAFAAWQAVANIQFAQVGTPNAQPQNLSTADIAIALDPSPEAMNVILGLGVFPDPAFADQLLSEVGYARNSGAFPYPRPEGDIVYYTANNQFNPGGAHGDGPSSVGFSIILHEIGHALGLKHPDDDGGNGRPTFAALGIAGLDSTNYTLMSNNDPHTLQAFTTRHSSTPMPLDILAIQQIYGPNLSYHTGDDSYVPQDDQTYTIWDAGGNDTINGSLYQYSGPFGLVLDLRAGQFSHVNYPAFISGSDFLLGIAYGVTVENATGTSGPDIITGNDAANVLDGMFGADTMSGGKGDDTYVVGDAGDNVIENPGEGTDLVRSTITYTLPANVENLTLMGSTGDFLVIDGTGNQLDNVITGNPFNNVLSGLAGNDQLLGNAGNDALNGGPGQDLLDGGPGIDELRGGAGDDTYVVDGAPAGPTSLNLRGDPGDYIGGGETLSFSPANASFWIGSVHASGGVVDDVDLSVNDFAFGQFHFWDLNFAVPGTGLAPGTYVDADVMITTGPALHIVGDGRGDQAYGTFTILAADFDYGTPTPTLLSFAVTFEQHSTSPTAALHGSLYYNYAPAPSWIPDTVIEQSNEGTDTVLTSIDYVLPANVENLTLTGSDNSNGTGNALDNVLTGNSGINILTGGPGNDTYIIQSANDVVVENPNEGTDTIVVPFTFSLLATNLENITLSGTGDFDATGTAGNNILIGNGGNNTLTGGAGNDTMIGGAGADTAMFSGNRSLYSVTFTRSTGTVTVNSAAEGADTLTGVENLQFADARIHFDLNPAASGQVDFADDFSGDVLWRSASGAVNQWMMNGLAFGSEVVPRSGIPSDWQVAVTSDFNGDGKADLAWRNLSTGALYFYFMNGSSVASEGFATLLGGVVPTDWRVAGASDFNGDGKGDLLWRNDSGQVAVWLMDGVNTLSSTALSAGLSPLSMTLVGTGDFNGDGKGDVLWRSDAGAVSIWQMDGTTLAANVAVSAPAGVGDSTDWVVVGTGDVDGDGRADVIWRNETSGSLGAWRMNGASVLASGVLAAPAGWSDALVNWQVAEVNDYDGDGKSDLFLRKSDGSNAIWKLDGLTAVSSTAQPVKPADWAVTGAPLAADAGTGDALANRLIGDDGNDLLQGLAGNDRLDGRAGNDILSGGTGDDTLADSGGHNVLWGGPETDTLVGAGGNEIYIGEAGNDTVSPATGADVIAFNRGDGQDTVNASTGQDNTVSLGGGIAYADLFFRREANDLVLETGSSEQIAFKDWYAASANHSVQKLQVVAEAMAGYSQASSNPLLDDKIETFDFSVMVNAFDQANQPDHWALMNKLLDAHLGAGSDTEALGGDLAYRYGLTGSLAGLALAPVQGILSDPNFGTAAQTLQPLADLQNGLQKLL